MPTCLEVLADWLAVIAQKISQTGEPSLSISLEANAEANAQSAAYANAQAYAMAAAAADSISVAMNIVEIDLRIEQTSITNLILPPLTPASPPVLEDYPSEETGVGTTLATTEIDGEACQLIYQYIEGAVYVLEQFSRFTAPIYMISSAVMFYLEVTLKAAVALGFRFPLPKQAAAAFAAALAGDLAAGNDPAAELKILVDEMKNQGGIGQLACLVYNAYVMDDGDTFVMAEVAQNWILEDVGINTGARVAFAILMGPSVWSAAMYLPTLWGVPATSHQCDECGM